MKMTQKEFAEHIKVSQGMISKWESGNYNFSIKTLAEVAEKLDMELYINLNRKQGEKEKSFRKKTDALYSEYKIKTK